jgi:hypothetical protein
MTVLVQGLSGQFYSAKPLDPEQCSRSNEVKLKFSKDKSGVFLVNYTAKEVSCFSEPSGPILKKFVKSKNQDWVKLDNLGACGTGLGYSTLESCNYTYVETYHRSNFSSSFRPVDTILTSLKYCVSVDSLDVCTEEIDVYLEKYRVLPERYYAYKAREWFYLQGGNQSFLVDKEKERQVQLFYETLGW